MKSPIGYPGGKFYAYSQIKHYISTHKHYVEPFCGGGQVFFLKNRPRGSSWLNDKNEELINFYRCIRDIPNELLDCVIEILPKRIDKQAFEAIKASMPRSQKERAAKYFLVNRLAFSSNEATGGFSEDRKRRGNVKNWKGRFLQASNHLKEVRLTSKDFEQVIDQAADGSFLFVDPPYYDVDTAAIYKCDMTIEDHDRLVECLRRNNNRLSWLMTYDNCGRNHQAYAWADLVAAKSWNYSMSGGSSLKKGKELFIGNVQKRQLQLPF